MKIRGWFGVLFFLVLAFNSIGSSITFIHEKNTKVKLADAAYSSSLSYSPKFEYNNSTVFELPELDVHFYLVSVNSKDYYLWLNDWSHNREIDLSNPLVNTSNTLFISKNNWLNNNWNLVHPDLGKLQEVERHFSNALDSINSLIETEDQYRKESSYNSIVWDSRSAKRLYNFAIDQFSDPIDSKMLPYSPSYVQFWELMYKLYYQYFHTNAFKGLSKKEIKSRIEMDFGSPESKTLWVYHFFRNGATLSELKENFHLFHDGLSRREKVIVEAVIQAQAIKDLSKNQKIVFLFGIDIDGAMEHYFARDSSEKKNLLVFWSVWNRDISTEFNKLSELKSSYGLSYNFIHICIDAYEAPEKARSFIYQNRVGGFHLLPEQSNAFRKSNYKKELQIRDFPFYILTDTKGEVIEKEVVPLELSSRLEMKLKFFSTKK